MKNSIIYFLFFISFGVYAHQPDLSSTILVEQEKDKWVLQVRAALTAFDYEIENHFGKDSYTSAEEFQVLVKNYVKENLMIQSNGENKVLLQNGIVKLGHETTITFEVVGLPKTIQTLTVQNNSFSDIPRNQNALMILKEGFARERFFLNNNNEHTVKLKTENTKFKMVVAIQKRAEYPPLIFVVFGMVVMVISFLFYKYQQRNRVSNNSFA